MSFDPPTGLRCSESGRCPAGQLCQAGVCTARVSPTATFAEEASSTGNCQWSLDKTTGHYLGGLWGSSVGEVWAVGSEPLYSLTGWTSRNETGQPVNINAVAGSSAYDVWGVGDDDTIAHYDGGAWTYSNTGSETTFRGVWVQAPSVVWAVGESRTHEGAVLRRDGGVWLKFPEPGGDLFAHVLRGVWGTGGDDVWVVGDAGTVLHRTNQTWKAVTAPTQFRLNAIWGARSESLWVAGSLGTLLHWDGTTFTRDLSEVTRYDVHGLSGTAANNVWAVGDLGVILHFNGHDWRQQPVATTRQLTEIWAVSTNEAWAASADGMLFHCY